MACVCVNGGGGCSVRNTTVQEYLTGFGVAYNPSDQLPYAVVLAAHTPAGIGEFLNFYKALGEACLRSRGLLFCNKTPGDCGSLSRASGINPIVISSQLGGTGISEGSQLLSALGVASPVIGVATAGAGLALTAVLQIFQAHAQAEQQQTTALCQTVPQFNQLVAQVDAAVRSGQASPEQGISTLQQAALSFKNTVQRFTKPCNAFCAYGAICDAMVDISQYYYGVSPIPESASGFLGVGSQAYDENPQPGASGIPGSVNVPPTPATSGNVYVPPTPASLSLLNTNISPLAIAAAIVLALIIFRKG